jgi:hypothetical protein
MKVNFLLLSAILASSSAYGQDVPDPIGFKMKTSTDDVKVFRDNSGSPALSHYKIIDRSVWFRQVVVATVTVGNEKYVMIRIPSGDGRSDAGLADWTSASDGNRISKLEYNIPLWIREDDFKKYFVLKYPKLKSQFAFGVLTVPFRIRPAVDSHPSSIFNGDFNIGTSIGYRLAFAEKAGASLVGSFGFSSLNQNSSNNSAIKDASSQSMSAVTYGGGVIVDWARQFQLGVIVGGDNGFGDYSTTYVYQNKAWIAISLNFKFFKYETEAAKNPQ